MKRRDVDVKNKLSIFCVLENDMRAYRREPLFTFSDK